MVSFFCLLFYSTQRNEEFKNKNKTLQTEEVNKEQKKKFSNSLSNLTYTILNRN